MKLAAVSVENFRCYQKEITVHIDDLTTLIGKNDIGKSTIMEALEIFFNGDLVKMEQGDANIYSESRAVTLTCEFTDVPEKIILDTGAETSLAAEYLLTAAGTLKVRKVYDCSKKTPSCEVFLIANHPTAKTVANLLEMKERDLQEAVKAKSLNIPLKGNPGMRAALWASHEDLALSETQIPMTKMKEDGKRIYDQIEKRLPLFALFQSDRSSTDSDGEVQNPMKTAVASALQEMQEQIDQIQKMVQEKAEAIASQTHQALSEIDPQLAKELSPFFTPPTASKWTSLFSVGLNTDDGIPLNKRGSGVRRLVLVSFFKAEAERRLASDNSRGVIYAIEEPETAQHPNNQRILIDSFKTLADSPNCQVILTTHSPGFAADLPVDSIRYVTRCTEGRPEVRADDVFEQVADALGLVPDNRVKVLFCVEGPNDVIAHKCLSRALHGIDPSIPDLSSDGRVAFIPLGGSTLQQWVAENYLKHLHRPEIHIYDRDVAAYAKSADEINARNNGSWATQTEKYEIENYLHRDAIKQAFNIEIDVPDRLSDDGKGVPKLFSEAFFAVSKTDAPMGDTKAKQRLASKAFPLMTGVMVRSRDPNGEVEGWYRRIGAILEGRASSMTISGIGFETGKLRSGLNQNVQG
jgi:predicted ATPase